MLINYFKPAFILLLILSLATGIVYPLLVTGIGQLLFSEQANGSLLKNEKAEVVGSALIGQNYTNPNYFWGRPSATAPYAYNASASSGSNLAPSNPILLDSVNKRIAALKELEPENTAPIPVDLITSSGSGLDPHISLAAAKYQISRIAKLRHKSTQSLTDLVIAHTQDRQFGLLGDPRVNVLELNIALDQLPN